MRVSVSLSKKESGFAWRKSDELVNILQDYLSKLDRKKVTLWMKPGDRLRLLAVWRWELLYHIEPMEAFSMVVPVLRQICKGQRYVPRVIGVKVPSLVGKGAERILLEEIKRRYPNQEHEQAWRDREQERQLAKEKMEGMEGVVFSSNGEKGPLYYRNVKDFIIQYRSKVQQYKKERDDATRRRRLPYRNTPWV